MRKGEATRQSILDAAFERATRVGLQGLTIGDLAQGLGMSKSGMFAHFGSKEQLQLALVEYAGRRFLQDVIQPALQKPRGEPRLTALFERWLGWVQSGSREGGCFFAAASFELDDQPGVARERLVALQRDFASALAAITRTGIENGQFHATLDARQVAFEFLGILLTTHHYLRLMDDQHAISRARVAFQALLSRARKPGEARLER
jgi:AcrR family transcriptional regulator